MTILLQAVEWGRLDLPGSLDSPATITRLLRAGQTAAGEALALRRSGLFAQGIAGVFRSGDIQVQIVPKVYADSPDDADATALLELMLTTLVPSVHAVVPASLTDGRRDISEHILRHLAVTMHDVLRQQGPPRRYSMVEEDSSTLRGRVDLTRAVRRTPAEAHRLPIRHHPLDIENPLVTLLSGLASVLGRRSVVPGTAALFRECARLLDGGRSRPTLPPSGRRIVLSRLESEWEPFVDLAEMIALGRAPSANELGAWDGFALMAPLESMFERIVRRALQSASTGIGLHLELARPLRILGRDSRAVEVLRAKPDYVLNDADGTVLIADAKWKRLTDAGGRPSAADVYQMATYLRRYGVERGALLYPSAQPVVGTWRRGRWDLIDGCGSIDVVEVDLRRILLAAGRPESRSEGAVDDLRSLLVELRSGYADSGSASSVRDDEKRPNRASIPATEPARS